VNGAKGSLRVSRSIILIIFHIRFSLDFFLLGYFNPC
jgi:hypothetical protein